MDWSRRQAKKGTNKDGVVQNIPERFEEGQDDTAGS